MPKSLRSFYCEHHSSTLRCDSQIFDIDAFRNVVEVPETGDFVVHTDGLSARKSWKEHGHISVEGNDDRVKIEIILHAGPLESPSEGPPIETRIADLLSMIKSETVKVHCRSHFKFPKGYIPKVILNYPAVLDEDDPGSADVTGQEVTFKDRSVATSGFIRYRKDQCSVVVHSTREVNVSGLHFHDLAARDFRAAQMMTEDIN